MCSFIFFEEGELGEPLNSIFFEHIYFKKYKYIYICTFFLLLYLSFYIYKGVED
jgi:hypothetical protein